MHTKTLTALAAALLLAACQDSQDSQEDPATSSPSTPAPEDEATAPREEARHRAAVEAVLRRHYDPELGAVHYFLGWQDLDGDGEDEAIVHVTGPMGCGTGGCDTLILQPAEDAYRVVTALPTTEPPIRVGDDASHGWRELMVTRHDGTTSRGVRLTFDGREYVEADAAPDDAEGEILIEAFEEATEGTALFETDD